MIYSHNLINKIKIKRMHRFKYTRWKNKDKIIWKNKKKLKNMWLTKKKDKK